MNRILIAIIFGILLLSGCREHRTKNMEGVSFSTIYVEGFGKEVVGDHIRLYLNEAGAKIGVKSAPELEVHVTTQLKQKNVIWVNVVGQASNGVVAKGEISALDDGSQRNMAHNLMGKACLRMVNNLATKMSPPK